MLAVWAVIAAESLSLKLKLIAATTGTITGDGTHSWLGRHYHEQLRKYSPFG
jgi:membrane protein DedA with SNARE-associated domain